MYNHNGDFMIVYLDLIILLNLLINYIFIKVIKIVFKEKLSIKQLILSLLLSIISFSLFFIPIKYIYNIRYFVGIFIGLIAFYKKDFKMLIIEICIFYLLNISFIGSLIIFEVNNIFLLFVCVIFISLLWFIDSFKKDINTNILYQVKINNKVYTGYLDTGNNTYCDNIPVIYLDMKEFNKDYQYYKEIKVFTIDGYSKIDIYKGPLLYINKNNYIVYYAFIKSLGKKVILNKELGE